MTESLVRPISPGYSRYVFRHLVPDERIGSVLDIDPAALSARGIKGLILDLDDTLVEQFEKAPDAGICDWIARARERLGLVILSNNRRRSRVAPCAETFGVPYVHLALKPLLVGFRRAVRMLGVRPHEVAVVGDQLFTDVLGGKRLGAYTILVDPLSPERRLLRRLMRRAESAVLGRRRYGTSAGGF